MDYLILNQTEQPVAGFHRLTMIVTCTWYDYHRIRRQDTKLP